MYENQGQKYIIYLKDNRNIVISDNVKNFNKIKDKLVNNLSNSITSNKIIRLETDTDIILIKPSDISAIQISLGKANIQKNKNNDVTESKILDLNETENDPELEYDDVDDIIIDEDDDFKDEDDMMNLDEYDKYLKATKKEILNDAEEGIIDFGDDDKNEINFDEVLNENNDEYNDDKSTKYFTNSKKNPSDLIRLNPEPEYKDIYDKPSSNTVIDQYNEYSKNPPNLLNSPDDVKVEDEHERINSQFKNEDDILNYNG